MANRRTSKDRLELHSFKLYSSFIVSFLCQQRLRRLLVEGGPGNEHSGCAEKLVHTLKDSITSFLSLQTTSMVPIRIWSMKHIALSSAFLLSFRSDLKRHPAILHSVEALIDAFSTNVEDTADNRTGSLNEPHLRALGVLREICSRKAREEAQSLTRGEDFTLQPTPIITHEPPTSYDTDLSGNMATSGDDQMYFGTPLAGFDSFWDDDFFSMLTGNANIASNDILDGFGIPNGYPA